MQDWDIVMKSQLPGGFFIGHHAAYHTGITIYKGTIPKADSLPPSDGRKIHIGIISGFIWLKDTFYYIVFSDTTRVELVKPEDILYSHVVT